MWESSEKGVRSEAWRAMLSFVLEHKLEPKSPKGGREHLDQGQVRWD